LPGGGDELQGLKKGIVEIADLVVVNKADGDMMVAARRAAAEYRNALRLLRPAHAGWKPEVLTCSALEGTGIAGIWDSVGRFRDVMTASGALAERRAEQARAWMWGEVDETLLAAFRAHPAVKAALAALEAKVAEG